VANSVSFPAGAEARGELRPASGQGQRAYHPNLAICDFHGYTNASKTAYDISRADKADDFKKHVQELRTACNACHAAYLKMRLQVSPAPMMQLKSFATLQLSDLMPRKFSMRR
jgi:hypothetical protein